MKNVVTIAEIEKMANEYMSKFEGFSILYLETLRAAYVQGIVDGIAKQQAKGMVDDSTKV